MSDNTEPVVTQEDRDAVARYHDDVFDRGRFCMSPPSLEKHFAAHRTAAVAKREAEIVGIIKNSIEAHEICGAYGCSFALSNLLKKLQTGGGA